MALFSLQWTKVHQFKRNPARHLRTTRYCQVKNRRVVLRRVCLLLLPFLSSLEKFLPYLRWIMHLTDAREAITRKLTAKPFIDLYLTTSFLLWWYFIEEPKCVSYRRDMFMSFRREKTSIILVFVFPIPQLINQWINAVWKSSFLLQELSSSSIGPVWAWTLLWNSGK